MPWADEPPGSTGLSPGFGETGEQQFAGFFSAKP
jgi:hypothetical protein